MPDSSLTLKPWDLDSLDVPPAASMEERARAQVAAATTRGRCALWAMPGACADA